MADESKWLFMKHRTWNIGTKLAINCSGFREIYNNMKRCIRLCFWLSRFNFIPVLKINQQHVYKTNGSYVIDNEPNWPERDRSFNASWFQSEIWHLTSRSSSEFLVSRARTTGDYLFDLLLIELNFLYIYY